MSTTLHFQIEQKIYQTPYFILYRSIAETKQQAMLVKMPNTAFPDQALDEQMDRDFKIGQQLDHPNIIRYLTIEQSTAGRSIGLENFDGIALSDYIQKHSISMEDFLTIAIQMAEVVATIHQSAFIHKDLNPSNFLINPTSLAIRLIDCRQATRIVQEKQQLVNIDLLEGMLEYISPEQTGRMNRKVDYRTDLYALGAIYYELLTGKVLFDVESPLEIIHAHIAQKPIAPHKVRKGMPKIFSKIIGKLVAKNAEDRYQSATGLLQDLRLCKEAGAAITTLKTKIGAQDFSGKLQIPQKLYGRTLPTQNLLTAFENIRKGGVELFLISGYSGVGKTSLVYEIHRPVTLAKGYFVEGKADQLRKNVPYLPWIQALTGLINQLLAKEEGQLVLWSERIQAALGDMGKVLTKVIPNLELLIGEQPDVPALEPTQAQNRFNYIFRKFTQALTADDDPLVLFLDDMQWADAASLNLLKTLLAEGEAEKLLVILAYRSNEVSPTHPFILTLEELYQTTIAHQSIEVSNLEKKAIAALIGDTLQTTKKAVSELTDLIFEKTKGNAFFVKEFLKALFENDHLAFSFESKKWEWDVAKIQQLNITDNVVDLLRQDIQKLPNEVLTILKMAACIGNRFDEATLTIISEQKAIDITNALEVARIEGYIEKIDAKNYKFSHDSIHQICYEHIPEGQKQQTHVRIGQLLFHNASKKKIEQQIFTITNHWNIGLEGLKDVAEKKQLFQLNLQAAQKAKASNAYQTANGYLDAATQLHQQLQLAPTNPKWFTLQKESAEVAYLLADYDRSEKIIEHTLENAQALKQQITLHRMLILQYTMTSQFVEAIEVGRASLKKLGLDIPLEGLGDLIGAEIGSAFEQLGTRSVTSLLSIPEMKAEKQILVTEILASMLSPSFLANQELFALIVTKIVNLSMKHGNVPASCFGYGCFGLILSTAANYEKGIEFGELAYDLAKRFNDPTEQGRACFHLGEFTSLWKKPFEFARQRNREGFLHALDAGDLQYAGYLSIYDAFYPIYQEKSVTEVLEAVQESLSFSSTTQNFISADTVQGLKIALSCLGGLTKGAANFDLVDLEEATYLANCSAHQNVLAICIYQIIKGQVLYLHQQPQKALDALNEASQFLPYIAGMLFTAEHNFYNSMTLAALLPDAPATTQAAYLTTISKQQETLKVLAENCPENWQHKYLLVEAELAAHRKEPFKAMELYRQAIDLARLHRFRPLQALGNERLAKLWKNKRETSYASLHLREALYLYEGMGATHKIKQLTEELTKLGVVHATSELNTAHLPTTKTSTSSLDLESVLKASQTLSSEIVLEKLLDKMMHIVMENAGAEKGFLLREQEGNWYVQAQGKAKGKIVVLENVPLDKSSNVPVSIVKYVARTKSNVVLQDATKDKRFFSDEYIVQQQPKSILCTSVSISGNQTAVLYLENNLSFGAFTDERVELLKVLSSQIAISLDNALLYQTMEAKVKERTAELAFQKDQSEQLLLNILPEETAKELKANGNVEPRLYKNVSILFIDIVGFTKIANKMTAAALVQDLDHYYKAFDQIMEKYGIEKIKTIGDAFFAAAGVPVPMKDHAAIIIQAAKDVLEVVATEKKQRLSNGQNYFEVRIGINSGSVIAGVVGHSKYSFDIWGSAVNIAARMESNSAVGKINISDNTYQLVKEELACVHRGQITAKGLGEIDMYFVE